MGKGRGELQHRIGKSRSSPYCRKECFESTIVTGSGSNYIYKFNVGVQETAIADSQGCR
jgi:hypothetical protein